MKQCKIPPYGGGEPYIYAAYASMDKHYVYPMIERLAKDGYRVWFDNGMRIGAEATAQTVEKISECSVFFAFISERTANSFQFKREFNFAVLNGKEIIVIMLEDVSVSPGMEMQLSAFPAIYKYKIENTAFYKKLYSLAILRQCLGQPDDRITVSNEVAYRENLVDLFGIDQRRVPPIGDTLFMKVQPETAPSAGLIKITTNEYIAIKVPKMMLGRAASDKEQQGVNYSLADNSMISRFHATIICRGREYYLVDCGAVNKTYLNGEVLDAGEAYVLHDGDIIKLANEKFRFQRLEV